MKSFLYSSSVYSCHLFLIFSVSVRSIPFLSFIEPVFAWNVPFSSVQFSHSVVSNSLWCHELQHTRPLCPTPTPRVHPHSCPSSRWCYPASSSVNPFSSYPQSLPASEFFPMSQLFSWGGQRTGVSALASFLPKKSQGWSPSEWTGWIFMQSKGLSRVFSNTTVQTHQFFGAEPSSQSNSHIHTWLLEKPKWSLSISNFLEEISSLSHSIVFLYFFALLN